jgi:PHD/YefM family antitoxin component YafN of YafNO toxin-antitoxin module
MYATLENDRVSVAEFALHAHEQTSELQASSRPKVLTLDGKPSAIVLSVEAYEKIAAEAYEHEMDRRLRAAVEAYANGERGIPIEEGLAELCQRAEARRSKP